MGSQPLWWGRDVLPGRNGMVVADRTRPTPPSDIVDAFVDRNLSPHQNGIVVSDEIVVVDEA
jgi:hypothetical protein